MEVNDIVRRLREDRQFTQENLADEIGVHVTTIIRYESKGAKIPTDKLEAIAKALNTTVADIYTYQKDPSLLEEPLSQYKIGKRVSVVVELDGTAATLNDWLSTLKKLNAALV